MQQYSKQHTKKELLVPLGLEPIIITNNVFVIQIHQSKPHIGWFAHGSHTLHFTPHTFTHHTTQLTLDVKKYPRVVGMLF